MAELVDTAEAVEEVIGKAFSSRDFGLGATLGLAIGAGVAYYFVEKSLRRKYEEISQQEIDAMREHYQAKQLLRMQEKPDLDTIIEEKGYMAAPIPPKEEVSGTSLTKARDIAAQNPQTDEERAAVLESQNTTNVFEEHGEDKAWDYETEVKQRSPERPYVIHVDEQGEFPELDLMTWTYYEGDEVLCNASDEVVTDVDRCVGLSNLDRFGEGSNDPDVVYVRNVILGIEVEICRSTGKYEEEVLGLRHADETILRRKRHFDDDSS